MIRAVLIASLMAVSWAGAADFNIESSTSSTLGDKTAGDLHSSFSALMDQNLDGHWHLIWGADYERSDFNKSSPVLPEVLQSLGAQIRFEYRVDSEDPVFMLQLQPGWHSGKSFNDGAFDIPITLGSGYPLMEHVDAAFGVYYSRLARCEVLPVGGLVWKPSKDVEFDLLFPNTTLNWHVTEQDTLVAFIEELGTGYQVQDSSGARVRLEYFQTRTGLEWEHTFAPGWSTSLQAGWALGRTTDFYEQNRTVTSPMAPFLSVGLKARF